MQSSNEVVMIAVFFVFAEHIVHSESNHDYGYFCLYYTLKTKQFPSFEIKKVQSIDLVTVLISSTVTSVFKLTYSKMLIGSSDFPQLTNDTRPS